MSSIIREPVADSLFLLFELLNANFPIQICKCNYAKKTTTHFNRTRLKEGPSRSACNAVKIIAESKKGRDAALTLTSVSGIHWTPLDNNARKSICYPWFFFVSSDPLFVPSWMIVGIGIKTPAPRLAAFIHNRKKELYREKKTTKVFELNANFCVRSNLKPFQPFKAFR